MGRFHWRASLNTEGPAAIINAVGGLGAYKVAIFGGSDMLIDELCDRLLAAECSRRVADVRIGLGYTGVLLDDGRCGLAYTFRHESGAGCGVIGDAGTLAGRKAADVAVMAKALDPIAAAVGLATLNAMAGPKSCVGGVILGLLAVTPEDEVGMVGNFGPLAGPLRKRAKAVHIFERQAAPANNVLSIDLADELLPQCQVAIITATSLLNRTMDGLLALCGKARDAVILGPSTPFMPEVFAPHGATMLSGVQVTDAALALRIISEGGGTQKLQAAMRKVNLRIR